MKRVRQKFSAWLRNIPINDPVEQKQAYLLQTMMIWLCCITLFTLPSAFFVTSTINSAIRTNISSSLIFSFFIVSIYVLRQGKLRRSVIIAAAGLLLGLSGMLFVEGVRHSGWLLPAYMVPMTLAGLLTGRRGILIVGGLSSAAIMIMGGLELGTTGIVGAFPRQGDLLPPTISTFVLSTLLVMFFFHRFSASLRDALTRTQKALATSEVLVFERTAALEEARQTRDNLELMVAERTRDLTAINQTMQRDLTLAHEIQLGLLPTRVPWAADCARVAGRSIPASDIGGDFYTYLAFADPRYLAMAVGDISGKGVGAALMMALMLSAVEAEARVSHCPAAILTALNRHFYDRLKSNRMNAALVIALIDLETHQLQIANAGMVFPLVLANGALQTIEIGGFPLGSLPDLRYTERSLPFRPGDMVILQSDGVAEAHNPRGELFGFERMEAAVGRLADAALDQVVDALFATVASFTAGAAQHDDITVVAAQLA